MCKRHRWCCRENTLLSFCLPHLGPSGLPTLVSAFLGKVWNKKACIFLLLTDWRFEALKCLLRKSHCEVSASLWTITVKKTRENPPAFLKIGYSQYGMHLKKAKKGSPPFLSHQGTVIVSLSPIMRSNTYFKYGNWQSHLIMLKLISSVQKCLSSWFCNVNHPAFFLHLFLYFHLYLSKFLLVSF